MRASPGWRGGLPVSVARPALSRRARIRARRLCASVRGPGLPLDALSPADCLVLFPEMEAAATGPGLDPMIVLGGDRSVALGHDVRHIAHGPAPQGPIACRLSPALLPHEPVRSISGRRPKARRGAMWRSFTPIAPAFCLFGGANCSNDCRAVGRLRVAVVGPSSKWENSNSKSVTCVRCCFLACAAAPDTRAVGLRPLRRSGEDQFSRRERLTANQIGARRAGVIRTARRPEYIGEQDAHNATGRAGNRTSKTAAGVHGAARATTPDGMEVFMVVRHHQIDLRPARSSFRAAVWTPTTFVIAADSSRLAAGRGPRQQARAFRIRPARDVRGMRRRVAGASARIAGAGRRRA